MDFPTSQRKRIKFALPGSQSNTWVRLPPIEKDSMKDISLSAERAELLMRVASHGLAIAQRILGQASRYNLSDSKPSFKFPEVVLLAAYDAD
jgi:hypothetical protein